MKLPEQRVGWIVTLLVYIANHFPENVSIYNSACLPAALPTLVFIIFIVLLN